MSRSSLINEMQQIRQTIERLELNLKGLTVLTEAATGSYAVTAPVAAACGAHVVAVAKVTSYGTPHDAIFEVSELAEAMGVLGEVEFTTTLEEKDLRRADILTNCGNLRPLTIREINLLRKHTAIPTMYEAWELRSTDIDLDACRSRGIHVAGTNERHPAVKVFDYLGPAVQKALENVGGQFARRHLVLCDNLFGTYLERYLSTLGSVTLCADPERAKESWDTVVIAFKPPLSGGSKFSAKGWKAKYFCQLWGDVDRNGSEGLWIPEKPPRAGAMGIPLTVLGAEPVIRLQAAGLKCGELMLRGGPDKFLDLLQWVVRA